ncbi:unnamed protein product [Amaranthus hypochondriacus]
MNEVDHLMDMVQRGERPPNVKIGFSAPQGCGKPTLVYALNYLFKITGRKSATISIVDFYMIAEGQAKLREENSGNSLLELRGNAGSHDLALSVEIIEALSKLTKEGHKDVNKCPICWQSLALHDPSRYNVVTDFCD